MAKSLMKSLEDMDKRGSGLGKYDMFAAGRKAIKATAKKGKKQGLSFGTSPAKILGTKKPKKKMYE